MSATDPLSTVWDALQAAGCAPHGQAYDFRSRCPAHAGENNNALHVSAGADGRAVLWCHAHQCELEDITIALELSVADLFPAGHRNANRRQLANARRADFDGPARTVANTLAALERIGDRWVVTVSTDCPYCGYPHARLVVHSSAHKPFLHCAAGCNARMFTEGLAALVQDREMAA